MPPLQARWFSLSMAASSSPSLWFTPPPQRTAYFSSRRSPGVVLRVSASRTPVPASSATMAAVAVAIPERRMARLRAVRSPATRAAASPLSSSSR